MEKEENVYVKTEGTEEKVVVEDGVKENGRENASAVPSKFKDVDALARAYSALQSEFTRRSQRLKELERKVENLEGGEQGRSGVEKLRKNAQVRKAEIQRFDSFVAEMEGVTAQNGMSASPEEPTVEQPLEQASSIENGETESAMIEVNGSAETAVQANDGVDGEAKQGVVYSNAKAQALGGEAQASVAEGVSNGTHSESLYAQVCRNEEVRLRIIGEYLSSLGKTNAPLMTGGVGAFTTPPFKAANIAEAGNMALLYFKKPLNR